MVGPVYRAEKALEMAYRHLPTLALIDIDLGGTIDGISVAAELAPLGVAVVFITADYKRAAVEGREFAADILIKPVTESTVLHSIATILQRKQEPIQAEAPYLPDHLNAAFSQSSLIGHLGDLPK